MDLLAIIRKAADGIALSSEEKEFLRTCDPGKPAAELEARNRELAARLQELENRELPENDRLRKEFAAERDRLTADLQAVAAERDSVRGELTRYRRRREIDQLAHDSNFTDPDYLEFLADRRELKLEDAETVRTFMDELREKAPKLFRLELRPGAGVPPAASAAAVRPGIAELLASAPEARN